MNEKKPINCEEALSRLFEFIDQELGEHKHDEMEDHLSTCRSCYSRLEFEKRLQKHMQKATKQEAPATLQSNIKSIIRKL